MSDHPFTYEFTIPEAWHGRKLKSLLQSELKFSTRLLRSMAPYEGVLKNGQLAYLNQPVSEGDKILVQLPREHSDIPPEPMDLDIRYEDAEVIVINKPPGMLTHPTARERTGTLLAGVAYHLQGQGAVPHSVHRLDRDTSGVVMFAKHAHIHHLFDIALRNDKMHRAYCALVWHDQAFDIGEVGEWRTIDLPIGMDPNRPSRRIITASGQRAITHYRVLGRTEHISAVHIRLETGRTHQIRLHFSAMGMPLVGDPVYGAGSQQNPSTAALPIPFERQALHAVHLTWEHPVTHQTQTATAPVASDIRRLWVALGGDEVVWREVETTPDA
jgi:23S rRNA pseudouridine1911/1915/1917 synthase